MLSGKVIIASFLVIGVLLVSGCCSCCLPTDPVGPTDPGNPYSRQSDKPGVDNDLLGGWASSDSYGDIVDVSGNFAGDAYSGEGYRFYDDGTYLYRIVASGIAISGMAEVHGKYRVSDDGKLFLYDKKENWYPGAGDKTPPSRDVPGDDETFVYWFEDGTDTLALMYESSQYTERFHRSE